MSTYLLSLRWKRHVKPISVTSCSWYSSSGEKTYLSLPTSAYQSVSLVITCNFIISHSLQCKSYHHSSGTNPTGKTHTAIKAILDDKIDKGKQYYRVVWADRPTEEASWVAKEQLENSEALLANYATTKKRKRYSPRQYQTAQAMTHMIAGADTRASTQRMDDLQIPLHKRVRPLPGRPHQDIIILSYASDHTWIILRRLRMLWDFYESSTSIWTRPQRPFIWSVFQWYFDSGSLLLSVFTYFDSLFSLFQNPPRVYCFILCLYRVYTVYCRIQYMFCMYRFDIYIYVQST